VSAPERNWDEFKGLDLKGTLAIVLINDPDYETGQGDFGGKAMTWCGRWRCKFEEMGAPRRPGHDHRARHRAGARHQSAGKRK
jgi:hypothetical protein